MKGIKLQPFSARGRTVEIYYVPIPDEEGTVTRGLAEKDKEMYKSTSTRAYPSYFRNIHLGMSSHTFSAGIWILKTRTGQHKKKRLTKRPGTTSTHIRTENCNFRSKFIKK